VEAEQEQKPKKGLNFGQSAANASLVAVIGGAFITYFRSESTPGWAQGMISAEYVRMSIHVVGFACAVLGLLSIRKFGRKGILLAALLGLWWNLAYVVFVGPKRIQAIHARAKESAAAQVASQAVNVPTQVARPNPVPATPPKEVIDYAATDFHRLDAAYQRAEQALGRETGENATVVKGWILTLNAWSNQCSKAAQAEKALVDADVLNPATIQSREDFVKRRKTANAWNFAVNDWQNELHLLYGRYTGLMREAGVSPERQMIEGERLQAQTINAVKNALPVCAAQKEVASQMNYTVGALETEHVYWSAREAKTGQNFQPRADSAQWKERVDKLSNALNKLNEVRRQLGLAESALQLPK
jgi:hypothetical protein